ncbi:MAG: hypothetical protein HYU37_12690 [Acidobacteria bacterium]|nr:hypothetical protein [Acidobacteriota bacterium]
MSCNFSIAHYESTLRAALARGYRFVRFGDETPGAAVLYLRHDVNFSLAHARRMACLEAALGVRSAYFVQCNSPFYNLCEPESREAILLIHAAGHEIGLHLDERCAEDDEDLEAFAERMYSIASPIIPLARVVSFHRPTAAVLGRTLEGFVNTYETRYVGGARYISDSRKQWREGCLCQVIAAGPDRLQALVHPEWWNDADRPAELIGHDILETRIEQLQAYMGANCAPLRLIMPALACAQGRR